ncbi:TetR family transcriptional regulator C-terminal domain-containing protein [Saxibacter everestensis]|uniref:TetR family transcriptional regulator C-terminal domain-containing protein n=1 Tax=Saxibacter everestensis TaxID=2909229 RepID=A0ABY8QRE3_9MICO|nr:TetR family transcriptional regulator C-terminal domain-containing protein [Brevibacteriaceae bacterium ZFBP1038]
MPRPNVEAERREQILSAACVVLAEVGLQNLRLAQVAKAAGVSSGTIHYYFETKQDVVSAAFEFNMSNSLERRQSILASEQNPLEMLQELVESYLPADSRSLQAWRVWAELWAEGMRLDPLQEVNERLYGQWRDIVTDVLRAGQRQGLVKEGDPVRFANMLVGMVDGLAMQVLLHSPNMDLKNMRETCNALIGLFAAR